MTRLAAGGTGYKATFAAHGDTTFVTQASQISADTDVVVFFGSINDFPVMPLGDEPNRAYATAREIAPDAAIIVVGPAWPYSTPPAEYAEYAAGLQAAASAIGATWVDPIAEGWLVDDRDAFFGSDGIHPTDAGHAEIARLLTPIIGATLP